MLGELNFIPYGKMRVPFCRIPGKNIEFSRSDFSLVKSLGKSEISTWPSETSGELS